MSFCHLYMFHGTRHTFTVKLGLSINYIKVECCHSVSVIGNNAAAIKFPWRHLPVKNVVWGALMIKMILRLKSVVQLSCERLQPWEWVVKSYMYCSTVYHDNMGGMTRISCTSMTTVLQYVILRVMIRIALVWIISEYGLFVNDEAVWLVIDIY